MQANSRIAVNTAVIYCRMIVTMAASLLATRYILQALGEVDFGIYNLVAGVAALFSFIAGSMATTTQRFVSYSMGQGDEELVHKTFYNSCIIHLVIAVFVIVLIEVGGIYLLQNVLSIPSGKLTDAIFVLHCVAAGMALTIVTVPFEALLMAHENILFISIINIVQAIVKLLGAVLLLYIDSCQLRIYAVLLAILPLICFICELVYCKRCYAETKSQNDQVDRPLLKRMMSFASWVLIGATSNIVRTQGTAMIINVFFGVIANAANGIAVQINGQLMYFSSAITTSMRPQLVQSAGAGDISRMSKLVMAACKYPFMMISFFSVPLFIGMPYVLELWLKDVPEYTLIFCRLIIIASILNQMSMGLTIGVEAKGNVKFLHLVIGSMHLLSLPVGYILFKLGFPPQAIMWCIVAEEGICCLLRVLMARHYIDISVATYLKDVVIRTVTVIIITSLVCIFVWNNVPYNFGGLLLLCIAGAITFSCSALIIGFNQYERIYVANVWKRIINRVKSYV